MHQYYCTSPATSKTAARTIGLPAIYVPLNVLLSFNVFFLNFCFGFGFCYTSAKFVMIVCLCVFVCMVVYNVNINVCQIGSLIIFIRLYSTGSRKCSSECVQIRRSTVSPSLFCSFLLLSVSIIHVYVCCVFNVCVLLVSYQRTEPTNRSNETMKQNNIHMNRSMHTAAASVAASLKRQTLNLK